MPLHQSTDLRVSRKKFDREIAEFRALGDQYRPRGWFLCMQNTLVSLYY